MNVLALIFVVGAHLAALVCVYACLRIAATNWQKGLRELLIFLGFVVLYWLLESWPHAQAPVYSYAPLLAPLVPYFDWTSFGMPPGDGVIAGCEACARALNPETFDQIPLAVLLMEAAMTFCIMHTAWLLLGPAGLTAPYRPLAAPLVGALVALALDGFLDPVLSHGRSCAPPCEIEPCGEGWGFWTWHATRNEMADHWFQIPLFNFAAWYSAPAILIALVLLIDWAKAYLAWLLGLGPPPPGGPLPGALRALIVFAFTVVLQTAPGAHPPSTAGAFVVLAIVIGLLIVWSHRSHYVRNNPFRWEFVLPQLFFFLFGIAALLVGFFSAVFPLSLFLLLLVLALLFSGLGLFYALSPYTG